MVISLQGMTINDEPEKAPAKPSRMIPHLDLYHFFKNWSNVNYKADAVVTKALNADHVTRLMGLVLTVALALVSALVPAILTLVCRYMFQNLAEQDGGDNIDKTKFCLLLALIDLFGTLFWLLWEYIYRHLQCSFRFRLEMPLRKNAEKQIPHKSYEDMQSVSKHVDDIGHCRFHHLPAARYHILTSFFSLFAVFVLFDMPTIVLILFGYGVILSFFILMENAAVKHSQHEETLHEKEKRAWTSKNFYLSHTLTAARNAHELANIFPHALVTVSVKGVLVGTAIGMLWYGSRLKENGVVESESGAICVVLYYIWLLYNVYLYHQHTVKGTKLWISGSAFIHHTDENIHKHLDEHKASGGKNHDVASATALAQMLKKKSKTSYQIGFVVFLTLFCFVLVLVPLIQLKGNPLVCKDSVYDCTIEDIGRKCGVIKIEHTWNFNYGCTKAPSNLDVTNECIKLCAGGEGGFQSIDATVTRLQNGQDNCATKPSRRLQEAMISANMTTSANIANGPPVLPIPKKCQGDGGVFSQRVVGVRSSNRRLDEAKKMWYSDLPDVLLRYGLGIGANKLIGQPTPSNSRHLTTADSQECKFNENDTAETWSFNAEGFKTRHGIDNNYLVEVIVDENTKKETVHCCSNAISGDPSKTDLVGAWIGVESEGVWKRRSVFEYIAKGVYFYKFKLTNGNIEQVVGVGSGGSAYLTSSVNPTK
eukprot:g3821.t1